MAELAHFGMGAHPFLTLTLWIAMFERDHRDPLGTQLEYGVKIALLALACPGIST